MPLHVYSRNSLASTLSFASPSPHVLVLSFPTSRPCVTARQRGGPLEGSSPSIQLTDTVPPKTNETLAPGSSEKKRKSRQSASPPLLAQGTALRCVVTNRIPLYNAATDKRQCDVYDRRATVIVNAMWHWMTTVTTLVSLEHCARQPYTNEGGVGDVMKTHTLRHQWSDVPYRRVPVALR